MLENSKLFVWGLYLKFIGDVIILDLYSIGFENDEFQLPNSRNINHILTLVVVNLNLVWPELVLWMGWPLIFILFLATQLVVRSNWIWVIKQKLTNRNRCLKHFYIIWNNYIHPVWREFLIAHHLWKFHRRIFWRVVSNNSKLEEILKITLKLELFDDVFEGIQRANWINSCKNF